MPSIDRRLFLQGSIAAGCGLALGSSPVSASGDKAPRPGDPSTTHDPHLHLFVDDHWIARQSGLARVVNQPQPLPEPVFPPHDPQHEQDCAWGNVLREPDGHFRMWYMTLNLGHSGTNWAGHEMAASGVWGRGDDFSFHPRSPLDVREIEYCLGKYAESPDGLHWTRPPLGLIEFRGTTQNNILLTGARAARQTDGALTNFDGYTILRDDAEPDPLRRFKMFAYWENCHLYDNTLPGFGGTLNRPVEILDRWAAARGYYVTFSPDGLVWDQPLERFQLPFAGDRSLVMRDDRGQSWRLTHHISPRGDGIALRTTKDLKTWSEPETLLPRTEQMRQAGHPGIESFLPFNYGNQDLGYLITQIKDGKRTELLAFLVSRQEGEPWQRAADVPSEPLIPAGGPGSYYPTGAVPLHNPPFVVGDRLLIFFNAFAKLKSEPPHPATGIRSIGVATLRRDGFVGRTPEAADAEGLLVTRPISAAGDRLYVNVEIGREGGSLQAAILDEQGGAIPGFGFDDSLPCTTDAVRHQLAWTKGASLARLRGQKVQVALRLRGRTVLYATGFTSSPPS